MPQTNSFPMLAGDILRINPQMLNIAETAKIIHHYASILRNTKAMPSVIWGFLKGESSPAMAVEMEQPRMVKQASHALGSHVIYYQGGGN